MKNILYVVHCIDTEGPLDEKISDTFLRLKEIFNIELEPTQQNLKAIQESRINFGGIEDAVAKCFAPKLLEYNCDWVDIDRMLAKVTSRKFRTLQLDDFGLGWVYSWHCVDHIGVVDNPRSKDLGYGRIFHHYRDRLSSKENSRDEINWHFHPLSLTRKSTHAASSYVNSYPILHEIVTRRIIEDNWFPVVNRPGFHTERPDSHLFLEQWIPFDYANQYTKQDENQPDFMGGRFGDWRRSPASWRGYHPSHDDYQVPGECRRLIFRCLNVGTRLRTLTRNDIVDAFTEAAASGGAILAFANHDWRDIEGDVNEIRNELNDIKKLFPNVSVRFAGAEEAARMLNHYEGKESLRLVSSFEENRFIVEVAGGEVFGPQPFLAIKNIEGKFFHDNFDVIVPKRKWSFTMDEQTLKTEDISTIAAASAGRYGEFSITRKTLTN